jgi:hypothetical protein
MKRSIPGSTGSYVLGMFRLSLVPILTLLAVLAVSPDPATASTSIRPDVLQSQLITPAQLGSGWTVQQTASSGTKHFTGQQGTGCVGAIVDDLQGAVAAVTYSSTGAHPVILYESLAAPTDAREAVASIARTCRKQPSGVVFANRKPRPTLTLYVSFASFAGTHAVLLTGPHGPRYGKSFFQFLATKNGTAMSLSVSSLRGTISLKQAQGYVSLALANIP